MGLAIGAVAIGLFNIVDDMIDGWKEGGLWGAIKGIFEGSESKELEIMVRVGPLQFIGEDFLFHFAIPQFLFHTTTAYDIIRHAGVEVMKRDFLGDAANR